MDTLFFILSLFSFSFGMLNLGGLLFLKNQLNDRGAWSLTIPLLSLLIITVLLIIEYYLEYRYPGRTFILVVLLLEWSRIAVAFSWNFNTYYHYALNGIEKLKRKSIYIIAGFSFALCIIFSMSLLYKPVYIPIIYTIVILLFYHAGIRAVLILRKQKDLLLSTRIGVAIAIISIVVYPVIGVGDSLGWRIPFLNPAISLWIQAHPLYFTLINIPFVYLIIHGYQTLGKIHPMTEHGQELEKMKLMLSGTEEEVLDLLLMGLPYKQIADILFISLPTVKTHIQHIYFKLGVKRRDEIFSKLRHGKNL